jgi:hypothetical protein
MLSSGDETCDVGSDTGTPVNEDDTRQPSRFVGTVNGVELAPLATTSMTTSSLRRN